MKSLYESILGSTHAGKASIIKAWLNEHNIKNYTINDKGEIEVDGDVNLSEQGLTEFPSFIQFGTVKGDFNCGDNKLISLDGVPINVGRSFYCNDNKLTSLKNAPKRVGRSFFCDFNTLKTLKREPEKIGGFFDCSDNKLKTLEGSPKEVGGDFYCNNNTTKFTEDDVKNACKVEKNIHV